MTIDSTWLHAFKEEAPHAFTRKHPFSPRAIFVDGQIKLMQGFQREPQTWDQFIHRQFTRHLQKWFETADVVILAFDNYEHVPRAKCMTQAKRRRHIPPISFSEHSELPSMVPEGERWTQSISNRTFKGRVIDLVLLRLPQQLLLPGGAHAQKRLIVDYREPREYMYDSTEHRVQSTVLPGMPPLGEADVKFTRYADRYGALMVDSIDGDSVPIALLHLERHLRSTTAQQIPQVSLYRMELHLEGTERTARVKRCSPDGESDKDTHAKRERRTYEFVHINALYWQLKQAIAQSVGRVTIPTHQGHEMSMLVGLIALTGTDFSRHLPQMSGKTVFGYLPDVWNILVMCFDPAKNELRVENTSDLLVTKIYLTKFHNHTKGWTPTCLAALLSELHRAPKMPPRIKATLPTLARIQCTVRNANWVLAYWGAGEDDMPTPNPVQPQYGFRVLPSGATDYDDLCGDA